MCHSACALRGSPRRPRRCRSRTPGRAVCSPVFRRFVGPAVAPPAKFQEIVAQRAQALAAESERPTDAEVIALRPLERAVDDRGYHYRWVAVELAPEDGTASLTVSGPDAATAPGTLAEIIAVGSNWWPLVMARELDDALQDKNWAVRAAAAEALGKLPRQGQVSQLAPLLDDDKEAVRFMAASSILRLSQVDRKRKGAAGDSVPVLAVR